MSQFFNLTRRLPLVGTAVAGFLFLQACSTDFLASDPGGTVPEAGVISMSYEAEMYTYRTVGDAATTSDLEKIRGMAKSARSQISVQIYKDGTADWTMEKLTPKHNTTIVDQTPPNPMPQTQKTRVLRDGTGYFYGRDGKLLHTDPVPTQSFLPIIGQFERDPTAINSVLGAKSKEQVEQMISRAKFSGGTVQDLGNGNISIRNAVASHAGQNARGEASKYKQVDVVNPGLGVVLGSSLYDEADGLVSQTFYRYKQNADKKLMPEAIYMKAWAKDPKTGKVVETVTTTEFDNLIAKVN